MSESWINTTSCWERAIILIDMNSFFASIEQYDNRKLRGRPVAVTNGHQGTCIITSSYEARAYGVKTGMRLKEARQLCPGLIQCASRPKRYAQVSTQIMESLHDITPDIEIFSVDEAFLDVTHCQRLYGGDPVQIARLTKRTVNMLSGLPCSVGLSGDKTTAKYAAKCQKPDGFTVIPPWEAKARLRDVPVTELCGIAKGIGSFLAQYGVINCGDIERIPISVLAKRFGNPGRRIWYMCQGADPDPIHTGVAAPKTMGHGKVMPPNTRSINTIHTYLLHMCEKLAARLRRHALQAQHFYIGLREQGGGWLGCKTKSCFPCDDGLEIYELGQYVLLDCWHGEAVCQLQVTALDPKPKSHQMDFLQKYNEKREHLNQAIDRVNDRYGEWAVSKARLLNKSKMPNVIAPAWKPSGHRQTV